LTRFALFWVGAQHTEFGKGVCSVKRLRLALVGFAVVGVIGGLSPVSADVTAPGQCKKQGPSDCNGQSECHGPHYSILPLGQKKKC
jgi:hypothetical protein